MSIKLTTPQVPETLTYEFVHMDGLEVVQSRRVLQDDDPVYQVRFTITLFAVDSQGQRHYLKKAKTVNINDLYQEALGKSVAGDSRYMDAITAIENALALAVTDKTNAGDTTVE